MDPQKEAEVVAKKVIRQLMGCVVEKTVSDEALLKAYVGKPHNDKKDTPAREKLRRLWRLWM